MRKFIRSTHDITSIGLPVDSDNDCPDAVFSPSPVRSQHFIPILRNR